jgi:RNA polymerase primary sigma factor
VGRWRRSGFPGAGERPTDWMSAVDRPPPLVSPAVRLTAVEERDLVVATEAGDPRACRQLVDAFLPQIAGIAGGFRHSPDVDRRELVQEGVAGLLLAARRFDPSLGTPFWGYASFWVRKAMQELVAELARPFALSDRAVRQLAAVRTARSDHLGKRGVEPSNDQLSLSTGLPLAQVERLRATERTARSLDQPWSGSDESGGTVGDRIADPTSALDFDGVLDDIESRETRALTDLLDDRERRVINAHYGLGQPAQSLRRIGEDLGVTAERVRQIEAGGLAKMRASRAGTIVVPRGKP